MRSVADQQAVVRGIARLTPTGRVSLAEAEGLVLAEDIVAKAAVPPFTNSAMDGYAVRAADVAAPTTLTVVGDIPAGAATLPPVGAGEAVRVMTGAPMPEGADAVVPVEQTDQPRGAAALPDRVEIHEGVAPGRHVRRRGENVDVGATVLTAGTLLTAAALSSIASVGHGTVLVHQRPKVAVITTGDELVPPGEPLGVGQIPDSNSLLAAGLARQFGAEVVGTFRSSDDPAEFRRVVEEAASGADVIVTTGGVSVGAFDVVRAVLDEAEYEPVAMQPGKPQASGRIRVGERDVAFLGLPGNPVSVFVSAWVFLRELLGAMTGRVIPWRALTLPATVGWSCPKSRTQYVPVVVTDDGVAPAHERHSGSHLVASLTHADALAVVAPETTEVAAGDLVEVRLIGKE